jgi:hypothetical protein
LLELAERLGKFFAESVDQSATIRESSVGGAGTANQND